jgi:uncharacterized membrane protein
VLHLVALLCGGIFAGAAVYISVVQQPAVLQAGVAGRVFAPLYDRATSMQASLAVIGSLAGLLAGVTGSAGSLSIVGALLLFAVVPYTLVRIKPLNDALREPSRDPDAPETLRLLGEWGRRHHVRSLAGGLAFLCFAAG